VLYKANTQLLSPR